MFYLLSYLFILSSSTELSPENGVVLSQKPESTMGRRTGGEGHINLHPFPVCDEFPKKPGPRTLDQEWEKAWTKL